MSSHQVRQLPANLTVGLDLGDTTSRVYALDAQGHRVAEATIPTTRPGIRRYFGQGQRWCVVLEVGTHSPWVSRELAALGHDVVVANPSVVYGKRRRRKRNDRLDAEFLARQGRADRKLLYPIQHRGEAAQQHLEVVRARDQIVQTRTKLVNHVRGAVKAMGSRLRSCSADAFAKRAAAELPEALRPALTPLLEVIADLTRRIAAFDRQITALITAHYPIAQHLQQPAGVGDLTALTYVLVVEDPTRFRKSRDVGPYVGLVPRLDESSESQPQLRITKAGDALCRRLLVSAAQYIMGPFGPPCDLRRHGEGIARRGGKNAKKRAVVAVARKLAVLLHQLWVSGAVYDPDYLLTRRAA
jgi:transposase